MSTQRQFHVQPKVLSGRRRIRQVNSALMSGIHINSQT